MTVIIDENLDIRIYGKLVYFTIHVRNEIDEYDKDTMFVCEIIDKGNKKLVSKSENRYESKLQIDNITWVVVWFDFEEKILIKHIGKQVI